METKRQILIAVIDGFGSVEQETTGGALAGRVRARIARRPGRWRERMQRRPEDDGVEPWLPEAA